MRILIVLFLLTSCGFQHNFDIAAGWAPGFNQGSSIEKRDLVQVGARHIVKKSLSFWGFAGGLWTELQFAFTEDAFDGHNYDLREWRGSFKAYLERSWGEITPYIAAGPVYNRLEADADIVDDEEFQVDVRAGVRWGRYFVEYQGMNTEYGAGYGYDEYYVNHWINSFNLGISF